MIVVPGTPNRGTKALRRGRYRETNQVYHVVTRTAERQPTFLELALGRQVIRAMKSEDDAGHTRTIAFVVMPDHLHWLFQLVGRRTLSTTVNTMKSHSARRINELLARTGRTWQKGFYDRAMRREVNLRVAARYVVANPLRAGIVESLGQYPLWDAQWI